MPSVLETYMRAILQLRALVKRFLVLALLADNGRL